MNKATSRPFAEHVDRLQTLIGSPQIHIQFLFDDLAAEAGFVARVSLMPFTVLLNAALAAFELEFAQSRDTMLAHNTACARLEDMRLTSGSA